jgi:hypothetical protein
MNQYDTGRATIDALFTQGKKDEALAIAVKVFPHQRHILRNAVAENNEELFREVCSIPRGSEWVDGTYLPGPFAGFSIPSPVEPTRKATELEIVSSADIVSAFRPLFVFVICAGGLVVVVLLIVVAAGSILTGVAAGLTTAFTIIGEWVGYFIGAVIGFGALVVLYSFLKEDQQDEPQPTTPTTKAQSQTIEQYNIYIKSNGRDTTFN